MNLTIKNAIQTLRSEFDHVLYVEGDRDEAGRIVKKIQELGDKLYDECVSYDLDQLKEQEAA